LGYSYENVWRIGVDVAGCCGGLEAGQAETFRRLLQEVESLDPVAAAAANVVVPYTQGGISGSWTIDGKQVEMEMDFVTPGFAEVMGLELVAGRWLQEGDAALAWDAFVIDRDLAQEVYGAEDPLGRQFGVPEPGERARRIVGVISDYRKGGELGASGNFMFGLMTLNAGVREVPRAFLIRVRPGTPAAFEETLVERLQGVAPEWTFSVKPMIQLREASFRFYLTPLAVGAVVAFFLLLMVGLGLIGVLWQNLIQRTREIGLRRAAGASRTAVHRQVVAEQLLLTTLGVAVGAVLVAQVPILDLVDFLSPRVFLGGLVLAAGAIYLLATLSALYPSAMASRIQPAEALHYE
jgi:putative ABC transport system permease protein